MFVPLFKSFVPQEYSGSTAFSKYAQEIDSLFFFLDLPFVTWRNCLYLYIIENYHVALYFLLLQERRALVCVSFISTHLLTETRENKNKDRDDGVHRYRTRIESRVSTVSVIFIAIFLLPTRRRRLQRSGLITSAYARDRWSGASRQLHWTNFVTHIHRRGRVYPRIYYVRSLSSGFVVHPPPPRSRLSPILSVSRELYLGRGIALIQPAPRMQFSSFGLACNNRNSAKAKLSLALRRGALARNCTPLDFSLSPRIWADRRLY